MICEIDASLARDFFTEFANLTREILSERLLSGSCKIQEFMGDGFLIYFAVDQGDERASVVGAVASAIRMRREFEDLCLNWREIDKRFEQLKLACSIDHGEVLYDSLVPWVLPLRRALTRIVVRAFRLVTLAKGEAVVLVSEDAAIQLGPAGYHLSPRQVGEVRGFGEMTCYEVVPA